MMLNVRLANESEIEEFAAMLKSNMGNISDLKYDASYGIVSFKIKRIKVSFQNRGHMVFAKFTMGMDRWDVHYPTGELSEQLRIICKKAKRLNSIGVEMKDRIQKFLK